MDTHHTTFLLGGLNPSQFMRRYWQKKPLLIRQAWPTSAVLLNPTTLFKLATKEELPSRLITRTRHKPGWQLQHGPFTRRQLPCLSVPNWTLLVQSIEGHVAAARELLDQFRFIPDARLDDVMVSLATPGGGVGAHFDSYDVFLLQGSGRRRWRIGCQKDLSLVPEVPLKILRNFVPQEEFVLEPGDMLYLPPHWAHEGVALAGGEPCMTYSIGFRAPSRGELATQLLQRLADECDDLALYRDPKQVASSTPAAVPQALLEFAQTSVQNAFKDPKRLSRSLGEYLSEPPAHVWFEPVEGSTLPVKGVLFLNPRSRMLYDEQHLYCNGESWRMAGKDAVLLQRLANERQMAVKQLNQLSAKARTVVQEWLDAGWLQLQVLGH